jgi:diguanylate cyclase (GGDEF)-like protein/PAS domain S-box-containing protein
MRASPRMHGKLHCRIAQATDRMRKEPAIDASSSWSPLRAAILYFVLGALWILTSDLLLAALVEPEEALRYQTLKGWLYVGATAVVAYAIVRRLHRSEAASRAAMIRANALSRVAAVAFETHEAIFVTDAHSRILRVNRAFEELTGYSEAEVFGKDPSILSSGRHDAQFFAAMWQALEAHGHWEGEIINRARDGGLRPVWERITAVRDDHGAVSHYVAAQLDLREAKNAQQAIARLSRFDALTGLPNRDAFLGALNEEVVVLGRQRHSALLCIDLDNFKQNNEALGHGHGDAVLCAVAERLGDDLRGYDVLARHAADEFLLLHACRIEDAAAAAASAGRRAERILNVLRQPFRIHGQDQRLTASIGVLLFDGSEDSVEGMLRAADTAMHRAKRAGRDTLCFFDPSMQVHAESAYRIASELRVAIEADAFELHYQPKVDLAGHIIGAEALLRWPRENGAQLSPAVFVPVAEEAGLMIELGGWVLHRACRDLVRLRAHGIDLPLSVNVSATQVRQDTFVESTLAALREAGAKASDLILEITESLVIDDIDAAIARLQALRDEGLRLSMDDFGTGYSSLAYLKRLPLDEIKIDRAFVRDAESTPSDRVLIEAIASVGRVLGLEVIAEGVETEAQGELLRRAGCTGMQGYLFGRPMPLDELIRQITAAG